MYLEAGTLTLPKPVFPPATIVIISLPIFAVAGPRGSGHLCEVSASWSAFWRCRTRGNAGASQWSRGSVEPKCDIATYTIRTPVVLVH